MIMWTLFKSLLFGSLVLSTIFQEPGDTGQQGYQKGIPSKNKEIVTLGGGCFWCMEAIFEELNGVEQVESGYSGGEVANPTYEQVCSGTTGHAEAVQITFEPKVISLKEILEIFFTLHDPTTLNRQGADVGTQYRSVIFYRSQEQKTVAEQVLREIQKSKIWHAPLVTELAPFKSFYKAEDYHQNYFALNSTQSYCSFVITPKIKKLRERFRDKLKKNSSNPKNRKLKLSDGVSLLKKRI